VDCTTSFYVTDSINSYAPVDVGNSFHSEHLNAGGSRSQHLLPRFCQHCCGMCSHNTAETSGQWIKDTPTASTVLQYLEQEHLLCAYHIICISWVLSSLTTHVAQSFLRS
jgi:hypothetical protein